MKTEKENVALADELRFFRSLNMHGPMNDRQLSAYRFIGWAIAALMGDDPPNRDPISPAKLRQVADDVSRFDVIGASESRHYVQHMIMQAADLLEGVQNPASLMVKDLNGLVWDLTENWKNTRRRGDIIAHLETAAKLIREEAGLDQPAAEKAGLDQPATEEAPAKTPKYEVTVIVFREVLLNEETDFSDRVLVPVGSKILEVSAEKGGSGRTRYYLHIQTPEGKQDREWMTIKLLTRSTTATLPTTARFLNRIVMPGESSTYIYQI